MRGVRERTLDGARDRLMGASSSTEAPSRLLDPSHNPGTTVAVGVALS